MRNMLVFIKDADESIAINPEQIRFIHSESATVVAIYYQGDNNGEGSLNLTVTSGDQYKVIKELARIACSGVGVITVADSVNSIFVHSSIEAVAAVTITA